MSSVSAGKFQDHYSVLGVDPKADPEEIYKAHTVLVQKYHPRNSQTGDPEKFEAVNLALEVLSDPALRRDFDKIKGSDSDQGTPKFTGPEFFDALARGAEMRTALLCILYDRRRTKPTTPSLSIRHIEGMLQATTEELTFVIWYLKQRGLIASDDKSSLQITVEGMDYLETHQPQPQAVMPFVKPGALAEGVAAAMAAMPTAAAEDTAAGLKALGQSLEQPRHRNSGIEVTVTEFAKFGS